MDNSSDEVFKWKVIAAAVHRGALDHCETFRTTKDLISYLHGFSGRLQEGATAVPPSSDASISRRKHHDFYYHPDNLPGPVGLGVFFSDGVADPCTLCKHASVALNAGRFKYKCKATTVHANALRSPSPEKSSSDDLNLRRLEHLAVMHTPYFVMLLVELVQQKHYSFHVDDAAKWSIASYVFAQLREDEDASTFGREHDSFKFLKLWWRFQDSRSTRDLKISMPSYFELCADDSVWNSKSDSFSKRKPEPLYTFLEKNCLCHEMWLGGRELAYSDDVSPSPRLATLTRGEVSTHCLSILIPKVHLEDTLHSLVGACKYRRRAMLSRGGQVSAASEPELDCLILEDVGHNRAVMMHTITSMDHQWQTLSSWLANTCGKPPGELPLATRNKVLLGVLGSLRDMCLQDKRPPRHLYGAVKMPRESKLTKAFFVHSETGDVLSLLPFVSLPRIHRSSNIAADEENFRSACAQVASSILSANVEGEEAAVTTAAMDSVGEKRVVATVESGFSPPTVHAFCMNGLVDDELWRLLGPKEVGSRDTGKISDVPRVWLGKDSRTIDALKGKLLELGFCEPLNVTIVEFLREEEARAIRESRRGFTTCTPDICRGLLSALTPAHNTKPLSDSSHPSSSFSTSGSTLIRDLSLHHREDVHRNKRSNNTVPDVARKLFQSEATDERVSAEGQQFRTDLNQATDERVSAEGQFRTDLNLTTKTFNFDIEMDEHTTFDPDDQISWGFSGSNAFYTSSELSDSQQIQGVLYNMYKMSYENNTQTLKDIIQEGFEGEHSKTTNNAGGHSSAAPDERGAMQRERIDDSDMTTDTETEGVRPPLALTRDQDDNVVSRLICENTTILEHNKHWKTSGFKLTTLKEFGYEEYKKMIYMTCHIPTTRADALKITTLPNDERPVEELHHGLIEPPGHRGWIPPIKQDPVEELVRVDAKVSKMNWHIGVETVSRTCSREVYNPGVPKLTEIPCTTLSCKHETQMYNAVNLSAPPENGFRHVRLIIGDFPTLTIKESSKLLVIKSSDTLYLGPVSTVQNVENLLLQKVFADSDQLLQDILTLHTTLQVHPFVPRTFTLHLMKTPFEHKSVVGMFVGEAAGEWNLGNPHGMFVKDEMEKFTLAYHVFQCLLRVQILCLRVLGFALKCIQPARIWRWRSGFRVDFISCLVDTIYMWHTQDPLWGGLPGLATISETMEQLDLLKYLPRLVRDHITYVIPVYKTLRKNDHVLERPYAHRLVSIDPNELCPLYNVYNMCGFAEQEISAQSDLDVILGSDRYEEVYLSSKHLIIQPYGPFSIQIHHQYFKWNEAIIVEPVLDTPEHLAKVVFVPNREQRIKARGIPVRERKRSSDDRWGANVTKINPESCLSQCSIYTEY